MIPSVPPPCVQMKTVSDPGVPMEEWLQVLTWQGVLVEAIVGTSCVIRSDKMDNLVVKGIAVALNNINSVFAATMKDTDQILAAVTMHVVCAYATHTHTHTHTHVHNS